MPLQCPSSALPRALLPCYLRDSAIEARRDVAGRRRRRSSHRWPRSTSRYAGHPHEELPSLCPNKWHSRSKCWQRPRSEPKWSHQHSQPQRKTRWPSQDASESATCHLTPSPRQSNVKFVKFYTIVWIGDKFSEAKLATVKGSSLESSRSWAFFDSSSIV